MLTSSFSVFFYLDSAQRKYHFWNELTNFHLFTQQTPWPTFTTICLGDKSILSALLPKLTFLFPLFPSFPLVTSRPFYQCEDLCYYFWLLDLQSLNLCVAFLSCILNNMHKREVNSISRQSQTRACNMRPYITICSIFLSFPETSCKGKPLLQAKLFSQTDPILVSCKLYGFLLFPKFYVHKMRRKRNCLKHENLKQQKKSIYIFLSDNI